MHAIFKQICSLLVPTPKKKPMNYRKGEVNCFQLINTKSSVPQNNEAVPQNYTDTVSVGYLYACTLVLALLKKTRLCSG